MLKFLLSLRFFNYVKAQSEREKLHNSSRLEPRVYGDGKKQS